MQPSISEQYWHTAYTHIMSADVHLAGQMETDYSAAEPDPADFAVVIYNDSGKGTINWDGLGDYANAMGFVTKMSEDGTAYLLYRFNLETGYYERQSEGQLTLILNEVVKSFFNTVVPATFPKLITTNILPVLKKVEQLQPKGLVAVLEMLYKDGEVIPFKNGIYSVRYNRLLPRTSYIFIENPLEVDFNPNSLCHSIAERYMEIVCGNLDLLYDLLEQCGYIFYARTFTVPSFVIFTGSEGRNGKSTTIHTIETIIGKKNASYLSMYDMSDKHVLSTTIGKYINIAPDSSSGLRDKRFASSDAAEFIKVSTEGEAYTFNPKYVGSFAAHGPKKFIFATNVELNFGGSDGGLERRMFVIPFDNHFDEDRTVNKLYEEKEAVEWFAMNSLVAFLCFVHRGCSAAGVDEYRSGVPFTGMFKSSDASIRAKLDQMEAQNTVFEWLAIGAGLNIADKREVSMWVNGKISLFNEYDMYCQRYKRNPMGLRRFNKELKKKFGINVDRTMLNGEHVYRYTADANVLMNVPEGKR